MKNMKNKLIDYTVRMIYYFEHFKTYLCHENTNN